MRNAELLRQVADKIESSPEQYDQGVWAAEEPCGTVACVGGWTLLLSGQDVDSVRRNPFAVRSDARRALGLTYDESDALFGPSWMPYGLSFDTKEEKAMYAAKALRELAGGADIEDICGEDA